MPARLARLLIQTAALVVLLLAIGWLVQAAADFKSHFKSPERSALESVGSLLDSLDPGLWLGSLAASVFVLTRLAPAWSAQRSRKPYVPFDFLGAFGTYIERESGAARWMRWLRGAALIVLAVPVLGLAWGVVRGGVYRSFARSPADAMMVAGVMMVLSFFVVVIRFRCLVAGLRRCAPRAETLLRYKRRRPILYLRSFATDTGADDWEASSMFLGWFLGWPPETYERSLAKAVSRVGPVVAVGQPGERLPPHGAARLYVRADEDWKRVVADLVRESDLVIMRIGQTRGFWWEFEHLVASTDPSKVVIYLPHTDHGDLYSYFRGRAVDHVRHEFPLSPGSAMFVGFDAGWKPRLFGSRGASLSAKLRRLLAGSPAPAVREALNGALKRLDLNARRLPFQFREWFIRCALTLVCLLFVWGSNY